MAILSTSFRLRTVAPCPAESKPAVSGEQLSEDTDMIDASESSSSDDSSGSEDASTSRPHRQPQRPTAATSFRRWFPTFGFSSTQAAAPSQSNAGKSRKRKNSEAEDELPSKRTMRH